MTYEESLLIVLECTHQIGEIDDIENLSHANEKTKLFGVSGNLDSVGLVSLTIEIEQLVFERTGKNIILADEKAMSRQTSPFRNVQTLSQYLSELVNEI